MKKSCKIFSAVALSAVLAMGTAMPAFANVVDDLEGENLTNGEYATSNADYWKNYDKEALGEDGKGASTNVNISTYSSSYSVTVPLFAPFMLDTAGNAGIAPSNYGIINGGEAAVFVTNVEWTMTEDDDWTFGEAKGDGRTPMEVVATKAGTKPSMPTYGSFVITLSPEYTDYVYDEDGNVTAAGTYGEPVDTLVPAPTGTASNVATGNKNVKWVINCDDVTSTKDDESFNPIALAIQGSKLYRSLENIQTNVAAITYTVDSRAPQA